MMSPAGGGHGRIALRIAYLLESFNEKNRSGVVYAAETGFILQRNPDTVRAPDVAFLKQSLADRIEDRYKFVPFAPTIAVEVMSPSDKYSEVAEKAQLWY